MITPANTAVLAVSAYEDTTYEHAHNFINSARKYGIPLRWLTLNEKWINETYNKLHQFLKRIDILKQQGFEYALILDALDQTFTGSLHQITDEINTQYTPNKVLFLDTPNTHYKPFTPYKDAEFLDQLHQDGHFVNSTALFGALDDIARLFNICLDLQMEFAAEAPRAGIATYCMRDRDDFYVNLNRYIFNDLFLFSMASLYHPEIMKTGNLTLLGRA